VRRLREHLLKKKLNPGKKQFLGIEGIKYREPLFSCGKTAEFAERFDVVEVWFGS
jgi:hypothetical protein